MKQSIRSYIDKLSDNDTLIRIKKEVSPKFEIPALMKHIERQGKAVLFERVQNSKFPVINNVFGSRNMLAILFETSREDVTQEFTARSKQLIPAKTINQAQGEYVQRIGEDVNLFELPIITHCGKDAAPYITAGVVIAKDPETGIRNASVNRMMLKDKNTTGIRMMPPQHLGIIQSKAEKMNQNLPVAIAIGNHPFVTLSATTTIPFGTDELDLAGSLFKEPLELIDCDTIDLQVPAHAEIILEGEVLANVREDEGPFGDFMQFYIPVMKNHIFKVKAMKYKKDAIYQTIQASSLEDMHLLGLSREAQIYEAIKNNTQSKLKAVSLIPQIMNCVVSVEKQFIGEPKQIISTVFGAYPWLKMCVVVDHDVDVFNIDDVWWAIATRSNLGKNIMSVTDIRGFPRDPFNIHQSKLGIDATAPLNEWDEFERKNVPGASEIKLENYL
jgi:2,5-furandicarboxylate decarboxylase 1